MALTLGEIITAARDRHPAFHRALVPHAVVARYLTGYQRRLISQASEVNAEAFAQQASIAFDVKPENTVGIVGAGTPGGLPAGIVGGLPVEIELPAGSALELDFDNAAILVQQSVVSSATATTLTRTSAGWTVNQFQNKYVWITDGPGIGQRRLIISNTAETLTISTGSDAQQWATIPTAGVSMFEIVNPLTEISQEMGVITTIPAESERTGYLIRLNSQGQPYIEITKPLLAKFAIGIDLPPLEYPIGGVVRFTNGDEADLELRRYGQKWTLGASGYGGYLMNGQLFLIGDSRIWADVSAIDLRYVPIAPALTALGAFLLLGENAYDALVARSALVMAIRVNGLPDAPKVDPTPFDNEATQAEAAFLDGIGRLARTQPKYVREVW